MDMKGHSSLEECLDDFVKPTYFNSTKHQEDIPSIEWMCDNCKEKKLSKKTTIFWSTPDVIIIFLKRFDINRLGNLTKNKSNICIPKILDMKKYIINNIQECTYSLISVGCHIGTINNGHYYSILKKENASWEKVDDDHSTSISENDVNTHCKNAYMCVYSRKPF